MRIGVILCGMLFSISGGMAQRVITITNDDNHGETLRSALQANLDGGSIYSPLKYVKVIDGTPFFKEEWMKAIVADPLGRVYHVRAVRINLLENQLNFKDAGGKEMIATVPLRTVLLADSLSGETYSFVS